MSPGTAHVKSDKLDVSMHYITMAMKLTNGNGIIGPMKSCT